MKKEGKRLLRLDQMDSFKNHVTTGVVLGDGTSEGVYVGREQVCEQSHTVYMNVNPHQQGELQLIFLLVYERLVGCSLLL